MQSSGTIPTHFFAPFCLAIRDTFAHRAFAAATSRARMAGLNRHRAFRFTEGFRLGAWVGAGTGVPVEMQFVGFLYTFEHKLEQVTLVLCWHIIVLCLMVI
jgi:hypothetical protein